MGEAINRESMISTTKSFSNMPHRLNADAPNTFRTPISFLRSSAVKDASLHTGKKVIVVFSNGPDNASAVPPEDVAELAQSTGTSVYMISTQQARLDPVSTAVFERMTAATGGKAYFAKNWRDQQKAFASIRDDLAHLYLLSYYPQQNPNRGWRTIHVKLLGERLKKFHVRTRTGYRPQPARFSAGSTPPSAPVAVTE